MSSSAIPDLEFFPAPADIYVPAGIAGPEAFTVKVQAFIVRRGEEVGLVDTLMQPDNIGLIEEALSKASAGFSDLRYVVITHHHPDHSGNLAEIARRAPRRGLSAAVTTRRRSTGRREWRWSRLKTATHCWVLRSSKLLATHPATSASSMRPHRPCSSVISPKTLVSCCPHQHGSPKTLPSTRERFARSPN